MTTTYERLEEYEVDSVRAYRRTIWAKRAISDPDGARDQVVESLRSYADAWVDGIHLGAIANTCLKGLTIGDLSMAQRYALVTLIAPPEETTT